MSTQNKISLGHRTAQMLPYRWPRHAAVLFSLVLLLANARLHARDLPRPAAGTDLSAGAPVVQVLGVTSSLQAECSRVTIDLSEAARFKVSHLSNPQRLYIDFSQTAISARVINRTIAVNGGPIERIRLGTDSGSVTRIVFDLRTPVRYRISKIDDPTRMLVELSHSEADSVGPQDKSSPYSSEENSGSVSAPPAYAGRAPTQSQNIKAEELGLNYAGAPPPQNVLALGVTMVSTYDDNILGGNQQRTGDAYFLFAPRIILSRKTRRLGLTLNYQPNFRIYRRFSELNAIDQDLVFGAAYRVTSRLTLRAQTAASYTNGLFQAGSTPGILSGVVSQPALGQTVYTPTLRQLIVNSGLDGTYQASARDSIGIFLAQSTLNFEQQISMTAALQNSVERDAGLLYRHRLTPHTTVGLDYRYQNIEFGSYSRTLVHAVLLSYEKQVSSSVTLHLFAGPQYSQQNGQFLISPGASLLQPAASQVQWNWASGGGLTKRTEMFVFQVTAQHQVTNGGGVLGAVVNSSVGANVRHRLGRSWDATWSAQFNNYSALTPIFSGGSYRNLTTGLALQHPLTEKLSLGFQYDYVRQTVPGNSPLVGSFDGNRWSVQLNYRIGEIALGR